MPVMPLSLEEREEIRVGLWARESLRGIARRLGRAPSTVSREVGRNHGRWRYRAVEAHRLALTNRRRPRDPKLVADRLLAVTVERDLRAGYSPAGIAVRLRQAGGATVCPETIYRALYSTSYVGLSLRGHECLRSRRRRRRPHHGPRPARRRQFGDFKLIDLRPAGAADRSEAGHWEGDLIIGANSQSAVVTLVERTTRLTVLGSLPQRRTAAEVRAVLATSLAPVPAHLRRSLTWDQGIEMADWAGVEADLDLDVYFCHPHSPWQRASNEHTNRQLRYWLPRRHDLRRCPQATLDRIATVLNTLPRRLLDWHTPQHLYDRLALR